MNQRGVDVNLCEELTSIFTSIYEIDVDGSSTTEQFYSGGGNKKVSTLF